jgi:predicted pyridoxine 5'-phosphate oxidase superfamily flavin-nucleotide-binding protein
MPENFLKLAVTSSVRQAQEHYYGSSQRVANDVEREALTADEIAFIQARNSFYLATVNESGWPYIQHRGGRAGFLRVLNEQTLAFADYRGNRQMLSTGNLTANSRIALFLMDYPQRTRLKILGHALRTRVTMRTWPSNWPNRICTARGAPVPDRRVRSTGTARNTSRRATPKLKLKMPWRR